MNKNFKKRRHFIKLASSLLAVPFAAPFAASLSSSNAFAASGKPPLRFLTILDTMGVPPDDYRSREWIKSSARDYRITDELGTILQPLNEFKENMLVVSGLDLDNHVNGHEPIVSALLTGSRPQRFFATKGPNLRTFHASLDVHIGEYLNNRHGLPHSRPYEHLFFSCHKQPELTTFCYDQQGKQIRSIPGINSIASSIIGAPLAANNDNKVDKALDLDILNLIQQQIQGLRGQLLNANSKTVLDAYQNSVDGLATELLARGGSGCVPIVFPDVADGQNYQQIPHIMRAIGHIFNCDLASSITYAIGGECVSRHIYSSLYNAQEHNSEALKSMLQNPALRISYRTSDDAIWAQTLIRTYHAEQAAVLLNTLKNTIDVDGSSVLDNTVVFMTSPVSHSVLKTNNYAHLILAGKNTNLRGGYHYDCLGRTHNDLLTTIAQGLMLPDDSFGGYDSNGMNIAQFNNGAIRKMLL